MASDTSGEYFSVSTIAVNPDRIQEAHACLAEVAEATAKEGGAKIYRFYKTEGKDEFVCMEKFTSRDAYAAHVHSDHLLFVYLKAIAYGAVWILHIVVRPDKRTVILVCDAFITQFTIIAVLVDDLSQHRTALSDSFPETSPIRVTRISRAAVVAAHRRTRVKTKTLQTWRVLAQEFLQTFCDEYLP
ncbi:hypothetical protein HG530_010694 [Fusarium avenaceum]|nr:hypothetical protein HG530_010694 [Fusarium avenaceum]